MTSTVDVTLLASPANVTLAAKFVRVARTMSVHTASWTHEVGGATRARLALVVVARQTVASKTKFVRR